MADLHIRFDADRRHGEWFEPSEALRRGLIELLDERGIEIAYDDEADRIAAQRMLDPEPIEPPVPARGAQGFWRWRWEAAGG